MSKVHKESNHRSKYTQNFDLTQIYFDLSYSPLPLVSLLSEYYGLDFENIGNKYISKQHTGIKIEPVKAQKEVFTANNYSNALSIKSGQFKTHIFELTKDLTGEQQYLKQVEILEKLGLIDRNNPKTPTKTHHIAQISTKTPQPPQSKAKENEGLKSPNFCEFSTHYGKTVLLHLKTKTGATVETLQKYGVHPTKSLNELRYSYKVGNTIKSKYPNRLRKNGKYSVYNLNDSYLFGFEQLPSTGKYLIFAAGEDDVLSINEHLNAFDVWAVCTWNETTAPNERLLNALKTRFKHLFWLGDNDNHQTTAKSQEIATKNALVWIDTSEARYYFGFPQTWDICDIHKEQNRVKDFIMYCIGSNYALPRYEDDPDSIKIDHCFKLNFEQHIGQEQPNQYGIYTISSILNKIKCFDRLILQSLAGTGKSTALIKLVHQSDTKATPNQPTSPNLKALKSIGIERVIVLEPTTAINQQLPNSFIDNGLQVSSIDNQSSEYDVISALESGVMMVCYDSFNKVSHLLDNALVVVDEYHQLGIDINFRNPKAFRHVLECLSKAKKVLLLSATPNYLFTLPIEICSDFGYKLIKGVPSVQNEIVITSMCYEGKRSDTLNYITENAPTGEGVITIKFDSKDNLTAFINSLNNRGILADYFCSSDVKRKEENVNYQSIMKTGELKEPLKVLGYTTLMEAGVSIKNEVKLNALIDVESWQKAIQLMSRARYDQRPGTNKVHNVWIFRSLASLKREKPYTERHVIDRFNTLLEDAKEVCKLLNFSNLIKGKAKHNTGTNDKYTQQVAYLDDITELWKPCVLWILRTLYDQEKSAPFALLIKRIERFDNRVIVKENEYIQVDRNEDLDNIRNAQKATKEEAQNRLFKLAINDIQNTAQTVCYLSKNTEFKDHVRQALKLPLVQKNTIIDFLYASDGAFLGSEPNRLIKDICFAVSSYPNKPVTDIVKTVVEMDKKTMQDIKSQTARKQRKAETLKGKDTDSDRVQYVREQFLFKRFNDIKQNVKKGLRTEWITSKQITITANKAIDDFNEEAKKDKKLKIKGNVLRYVNDKKAMQIINDLYHVDRKQIREGNKRFWAYKIGERKGIENAFFEGDN
jgi:hypothetical protein